MKKPVGMDFMELVGDAQDFNGVYDPKLHMVVGPDGSVALSATAQPTGSNCPTGGGADTNEDFESD